MASSAERDHLNRKLGCLEHCALHRRTIKVTCPECQRVVRFDAVALWYLFFRKRWNDAYPACMRRFYCQECRTNSGQIIRPRFEITEERPDPKQPQYPDQSTWRKLVSRYRS